MKEVALFAGCGGGLLASHLLGITPIVAVEKSPYRRAVLRQRQVDGVLPTFHIHDDVLTFDATPYRGVDVVSGGFPCQAFSKAAAGKNIASKNLWPQMLRVVIDARPAFVFAENVITRAIEEAASDLHELGYSSVSTILGAGDLGAPHERKRSWLLAYTDLHGKFQLPLHEKASLLQKFCQRIWPADPSKFRVSDGVANRMERLTAIGDGQVPFVAAIAWWVLLEAALKREGMI